MMDILTMTSHTTLFEEKKQVIVLSYAPAGLGHLRVVNAFHQGLPDTLRPVILGASDRSLTFLHRITSINPVLRQVFEWVQQGAPQRIFTRVYRTYLHKHTGYLKKLFTTTLLQQPFLPDTVIVLSTHFALSHQLAQIKKEIEKEQKIRIILVVIVTDDSPQYIWYTPGADVVCVPSEYTKNELITYGKAEKLEDIPVKVFPYPISPRLANRLSEQRLKNRLLQYQKHSETPIHVAVPVSGAAVGLSYALDIMHTLHRKSKRFRFHVVSKIAPFTRNFLQACESPRYINVYADVQDRKVVHIYDELFYEKTIGFEITKPSEQSFKALYNPTHIGGCFLFFSKPIGRQEYDNIAFLRRHALLPDQGVQQLLWKYAKEGRAVDQTIQRKLSHTIRSFLLPEQSTDASQFIYWCLYQQLCEHIVSGQKEAVTVQRKELGTDGVAQVWSYISRYSK